MIISGKLTLITNFRFQFVKKSKSRIIYYIGFSSSYVMEAYIDYFGGNRMKLFKKIGLFVVTGATALGLGLSLNLNHVEVNAANTPGTYTYDLVTNFSTYASAWSTSYTTREVLSSDIETAPSALPAAKISFSSANKQTSTITTMPVSKACETTIEVTEAGLFISKIQFIASQWTTKIPSVNVKQTNAFGTSLLTASALGLTNSGTTGTEGTTGELTVGDSIKSIYIQNTSANQIGWNRIILTLAEGSAVAVSGVSLNKTTSMLYVGATEKLVPTVTPANATNKSVTWSSDNTAAATVDSFGNVTAVGIGNAKITVETVDLGFKASCNYTITGGPAYSYSAITTDLPDTTINGSSVTLNGLSWGVSWTNGPAASTVGVSAFDGSKGFHFGTNAAPTGSVSLRSKLYVNPSDSSSLVSNIIIETSSGANNKAQVKFEVFVGGVLINSYEPTDASTSTEYSFTPSSSVYGHIEIVMTNKLNYIKVDPQIDGAAALYIKSIKVWSSVNTDLTSAVQFANDLESFNSCGDGTGYSTLASTYATLSANAISYLSSIKLDDKNNLGEASGASIQKDIVLAASKWSYVSAKFGGGSGAVSVNVFGQKSIYLIVIVAIAGVTVLGGYFFTRKKKEI